MATSRRAQVNAAIKKIRAFHDLGRDMPRKRRHKEIYNRKVVESEAESRGISEDTIRKARQFADPIEGYTWQELNKLCRLIREVQPGQDETKAIFRRTHVIRLLSVPRDQGRDVLQDEAIENGWSAAELEAEIAKRFGTRRAGGRRRRIPPDPAGLLVQLEAMCEQWRRWEAEVTREPEGGEGGHASLSDLPEGVRKQVVDVGGRVWHLHKAVVGALKEAQPRRELRHVFQEEASQLQGKAGRKKGRASQR